MCACLIARKRNEITARANNRAISTHVIIDIILFISFLAKRWTANTTVHTYEQMLILNKRKFNAIYYFLFYIFIHNSWLMYAHIDAILMTFLKNCHRFPHTLTKDKGFFCKSVAHHCVIWLLNYRYCCILSWARYARPQTGIFMRKCTTSLLPISVPWIPIRSKIRFSP